MDYISPFTCNLTRNVTENSSLCQQSISTPSAPMVNPYDGFFKFAFGSAIYMIIVSFTTIVSNGLLLVVFFLDPFKMFRNATTYFLVGLAFVDMLTAVTQEPMYATCFIMMYIRHPDIFSICPPLLTIGENISLNASFLIVLAFTVTQYIVVISPLNHARKVTKTRVIICVLAIYLYVITIGVLSLTGVTRGILYKVENFLFIVSIYLTMAFYVLLYISFKKKMNSSKNLREDNVETGVERKFITINFLLIAILFFCSQPCSLWTIVHLYPIIDPNSPTTLITFLLMENLLYLKFLLDPFVYAWRIPKYRQALKIIFHCRRTRTETKATFSDRVVARMSKSRETVVTLDFKSIPPE